MGFGMGHCLETVLAPAALKGTDLMAAADHHSFLCTVLVKYDIVSRMLA